MDMDVETQPIPVTYPPGALHMDDDSECTSPGVCGRDVYWRGGAPLHTFGE